MLQVASTPAPTSGGGGGESNSKRLAKIIVPSVVGGLIVLALLAVCLLVSVVGWQSSYCSLLFLSWMSSSLRCNEAPCVMQTHQTCVKCLQDRQYLTHIPLGCEPSLCRALDLKTPALAIAVYHPEVPAQEEQQIRPPPQGVPCCRSGGLRRSAACGHHPQPQQHQYHQQDARHRCGRSRRAPRDHQGSIDHSFTCVWQKAL